MDKMPGGLNFIGKSTEPKPDPDEEKILSGETLYFVDTKEAFVYYDREWWDA